MMMVTVVKPMEGLTRARPNTSSSLEGQNLTRVCWMEQCTTPVTLAFDAFIDIFFIVDIILKFNTGIMRPGKSYIDDRVAVAKNYLNGSFLFDVLTSFPVASREMRGDESAGILHSHVNLTRAAWVVGQVSFFELSVQAACAASLQEDSSIGGTQLRFVRAIKPLRWFKIVRVLKLGRVSSTIVFFMDCFEISPKQGQSAKAVVVFVFFIHMLASLWWLLKVVSQTLPPLYLCWCFFRISGLVLGVRV